MAKVDARYTDFIKETLTVLNSPGLLLVSAKKDGTANVMTIGWGTIGVIWGKPIFPVLVRPSRHTYQFMEDSGEFTINVPPKDMNAIVAYCGTASGRDQDKFTEKSLTTVKGKTIDCPIIDECVIHYECKVVHKNDVIPPELTSDITTSCYPQGDFHTIYFGEILATYADADVRSKL